MFTTVNITFSSSMVLGTEDKIVEILGLIFFSLLPDIQLQLLNSLLSLLPLCT